jgi:hypothetical protein
MNGYLEIVQNLGSLNIDILIQFKKNCQQLDIVSY